MNQTRIGSLIESGMNIAIGYFVALASQLAIFPMFDIHIPLSDNIAIGAWFTVISLIAVLWFVGGLMPDYTGPQ